MYGGLKQNRRTTSLDLFCRQVRIPCPSCHLHTSVRGGGGWEVATECGLTLYRAAAWGGSWRTFLQKECGGRSEGQGRGERKVGFPDGIPVPAAEGGASERPPDRKQERKTRGRGFTR